MFETVIKNLLDSSVTGLSIALTDVLLSIVISFALGGIIFFTYRISNQGEKSSENFGLTLIFLPAVISAIIMLIGSDVARAFSLAGAFSIIRFRSAPGEPKDIAFVLFALAAGLSSGVGLYGYGMIFSLAFCLMMFIISKSTLFIKDSTEKLLQITVPEDLDYDQVLNPVLEAHTDNFMLIKVKLSALGSLYQLSYSVRLKDTSNIKPFIDELRCRNGNLNIQLNLMPEQYD